MLEKLSSLGLFLIGGIWVGGAGDGDGVVVESCTNSLLVDVWKFGHGMGIDMDSRKKGLQCHSLHAYDRFDSSLRQGVASSVF